MNRLPKLITLGTLGIIDRHVKFNYHYFGLDGENTMGRDE